MIDKCFEKTVVMYKISHFYCMNVTIQVLCCLIWAIFFYFQIASKHTCIVISFYKTSDINDSMNTLISCVVLKIYKYEMKCRLVNIYSTKYSVYNSVKMSLNTYQYIIENSYENMQTHKLFKKAFKIM